MYLSEMLTTRFSHEISGLISAIRVGIDYINHKDASIQKQSEEILFNAATIISKKIEFFRELYGYGPEQKELHINYVVELIQGLFYSKEVIIEVSDKRNGTISRFLTKLILCLVSIESKRQGLKKVKLIIEDKSCSISFDFSSKPNILIADLFDVLFAKDWQQKNPVSVENIDLHYIHYLNNRSNEKINFDLKKEAEQGYTVHITHT